MEEVYESSLRKNIINLENSIETLENKKMLIEELLSAKELL